MWINAAEVQLSGDQEDHGPDRGHAREAAVATFRRLEKAVYRFEKSIGLARLRPRHNALQVIAHHRRNRLHRLDLRAHHAGAPVPEHRAHHVDLLALEDLAQLLLVDPRARRAHRCQACNDTPENFNKLLGSTSDDGGKRGDYRRLRGDSKRPVSTGLPVCQPSISSV